MATAMWVSCEEGALVGVAVEEQRTTTIHLGPFLETAPCDQSRPALEGGKVEQSKR